MNGLKMLIIINILIHMFICALYKVNIQWLILLQ